MSNEQTDLGEWDGEKILNGRVKIGSMEVLHNEAVDEGNRLVLVLEVEQDTKKGSTVKRVDGVLTRITNLRMSRVRRLHSGVDTALLNQVMEWLSAQEADDTGTEPFDFTGEDNVHEDVDVSDVVDVPELGAGTIDDAEVVDDTPFGGTEEE